MIMTTEADYHKAEEDQEKDNAFSLIKGTTDMTENDAKIATVSATALTFQVK